MITEEEVDQAEGYHIVCTSGAIAKKLLEKLNAPAGLGKPVFINPCKAERKFN